MKLTVRERNGAGIVTSRKRDMGLGTLTEVPIELARERAQKLRDEAKQNVARIVEPVTTDTFGRLRLGSGQRYAPPFGQAADDHVAGISHAGRTLCTRVSGRICAATLE